MNERISTPPQTLLDSYVQWRFRGSVCLKFSFDWPIDLQPLADGFQGYTWALDTRTSSRALGICSLPGEPAYYLSEIESNVFAPRSNHYVLAASHGEEFYLMIELNRKRARAEVVKRVPPGGWDVRDEHMIRMPPANG